MRGPSGVRTSLFLLLALVACGPKEEITPEIAISPGFEGRLAMMDRYRLHDEDRRRMMVRPHVWVEGVPDDEDAGAPADDAGE